MMSIAAKYSQLLTQSNINCLTGTIIIFTVGGKCAYVGLYKRDKDKEDKFFSRLWFWNTGREIGPYDGFGWAPGQPKVKTSTYQKRPRRPEDRCACISKRKGRLRRKGLPCQLNAPYFCQTRCKLI